MCRSGRMFAPTKIWRKWHVKINQGQKYVERNLVLEDSDRL
jgi:ribosomal protein L4